MTDRCGHGRAIADVRSVKRAPLLFDGRRSVLGVDLRGQARTELQRHRIDRLDRGASPPSDVTAESVESGSLVAAASLRLGGIGFFLRDRTIWAVVDRYDLRHKTSRMR